MKKALILSVMILLGCCTMNAAVKKVALRVLYVGGSPEFDTIGNRDADSTVVAKSAQERTASFDAYLRQYFTIVKSINAKDYTPEMSKHYDVTIIDGTPKPIEIKKYTINTKWGEREMQDKIYFPKDFDRPVLTIAEAGEKVGRGSGIKSDWYCLCLHADAHSSVSGHPIFQGPFKVNLNWMVKETPYPAKHEYYYFSDKPIPDSIPMWRVQNTDTPETRNYRIGMVARPWGFTDSPDCEYISSGVCDKTIDAVAIGRHANFFHWGFSASPKYLTEQGKTVLANAIAYIAKYAGHKPIARKWNDRIATKSYVKELRYLASREGWKSLSEITEKSNEQMKHFADSIKQVIERGGTVSEMEKMYAQYEPEPPMSYEQFLQRYQDKLFDQFGTDEQRYFDYYDQNLDYFYGGQGSYELTIDEDCKQLGIAVGDKRLLDKAISLWEEGSKAQASIPAGQLTNPQHQDKIDMAKRLLYRYTLLRFATPQEWRSWYNTYGDRLFWTESGGWLFLINTEDPNIPGNDYAVIGK
jgi:hypothetical protein